MTSNLEHPSVAEIIVDSLVRHGVTTVFAQSLPSAVVLAAEERQIRQFMYRTENAGTAMADGYARTSGKVGVVSAQNGPAATLLVPGLAEALKASVPVLALVQDVVRTQTDRNAFQELDHLALFQSCTKWVRRVTEPSRVADYVDMAFTNAASGRPGPVALILPADLLLEKIPAPTHRNVSLGHYPLDRCSADPDRLDEAAKMLAEASNPLIVAGGGVHLSGACDELSRLQQIAHIPVMTTVMGKGAIDETHPLSIGMTGYAMAELSPTHYMRSIIDGADVILLVGTRTNQNGTDSWTLYPQGSRYIHIDIDGGEVGRNYEAVRLVGDAKLTLAALCDRLAGARDADPEIVRKISEARAMHRLEISELLHSNAVPIRPERIVNDMREVLTPDTIVVADASYATLWTTCYLPSLRSGMRFLTPRGLAGLGWGLPLAIGAKVANPDSPVLCMVGDGGFAHVWSELETAARTRTPVVISVLNNGCLAYQKDAEDVKFGRHSTGCYFSPVDHAAIARASGCRGVRIDRPDDYLPALREAMSRADTTVLDIMIDPAAYPPITFFQKLDSVRAARESTGSTRSSNRSRT
ncbi:MAG: acetolactate synthase catalytic subunit [Gammaproteobacteria bacterium]|nr:acetolactate synthase catalytic subunit [Gammaproteobacteria bacterium]MDH5310738.1 acetolactate synthase catalytic subunit [Gammaproteobacteria bacterium]